MIRTLLRFVYTGGIFCYQKRDKMGAPALGLDPFFFF